MAYGSSRDTTIMDEYLCQMVQQEATLAYRVEGLAFVLSVASVEDRRLHVAQNISRNAAPVLPSAV